MPTADALRWNARYAGPGRYSRAGSHPLLRRAAPRLPPAGLALEAAMGLGGNAGWLLERGWRVVGLDIAEVAVRRAKARWPALAAAVVDLTQLTLPPDHFDLILNFYYLDRALWPVYRQALKPGGLLLCETMTRAMLAERPDLPPEYLLAPGELRAAFADWDILMEYEGWLAGRSGHRKAVAQLVARRPAAPPASPTDGSGAVGLSAANA